MRTPCPDGTWDQVFEYMSEQVIQKKDKTILKKLKALNTATTVPDEIIDQASEKVTARNESTARKCRVHIPLSIQREVINRDKCCQYQSKITNQKCNSTWKLTIDHIQPLWAGGSSEPENLRALCAAHNNKVYQEQTGITYR